MTRNRNNTLSNEYIRWLEPQVRQNTRLVLARLRPLAERLRAALDRDGYAVTLALLDSLVTESDHARLLAPIYAETGVAAAGNEYTRLVGGAKSSVAVMRQKDRDTDGGTGDPLGLFGGLPKPEAGFFSASWRAKMTALLQSSETAKRITHMTTHTRQLVRDVLSRGQQQGYGVQWATKKIAGLLTGKAGKKRAVTIARTETNRAANAGHEAGAASTLLKLKKRWVATADDRTRPAHRAMIGKAAIEKDDLFVVGGARMKYPGDPAGGAANCCHCRCRVLYVPA